MRRTDAYKAWIGEAQIEALKQSHPWTTLDGPYKLSITAARPDKRKRDLDNIIKPISDALMHCLIVSDDSLCEMVTARWVTNGEGVCVRVEKAGIE